MPPKKITAAFDDGRTRSDGGVILPAAIESSLGVAKRFASVIDDQQRMKLGLKQSELAARCGIDQSVISKIERGEFNLTIKQMSRLANALDGDVAAMLKAQLNDE